MDCPSAEGDTPAKREAIDLELNLGFIAGLEFSLAIPVRVSMRFYVFTSCSQANSLSLNTTA